MIANSLEYEYNIEESQLYVKAVSVTLSDGLPAYWWSHPINKQSQSPADVFVSPPRFYSHFYRTPVMPDSMYREVCEVVFCDIQSRGGVEKIVFEDREGRRRQAQESLQVLQVRIDAYRIALESASDDHALAKAIKDIFRGSESLLTQGVE